MLDGHKNYLAISISSGESSLSPKPPNNSLTIISDFISDFHYFMSVQIKFTFLIFRFYK